MKPTLLILAAGMGNRYWGLKQIDSFGPSWETLLEYSIFDAHRAGFGKVVFVIRESFEQEFKEKVLTRLPKEILVEIVYQPVSIEIPWYGYVERTKPWWVAHAVLVAKDSIHEPFAVVNADDYYGSESYGQMVSFLNNEVSQTVCCMVSYVLRNTLSVYGAVNRWVCLVSDTGMLQDVQEHYNIVRHGDDAGIDKEWNILEWNSPVSMNFWWFDVSFFSILEETFTQFLQENHDQPSAECVLPRVVDRLIKNRAIACSVLKTDALRCGVTHSDDKPMVTEFFNTLVAAWKYPAPLRNDRV